MKWFSETSQACGCTHCTPERLTVRFLLIFYVRSTSDKIGAQSNILNVQINCEMQLTLVLFSH